MKKLVSLIVLGALALGLSGCSGSDSTTKPADQQKLAEPPSTPKDGV